MFGCCLNSYESEVMCGYVDVVGLEGVIIVNMCVVMVEVVCMVW